MASLALGHPIFTDSIRTLTLANEPAGSRIEALPDRLEILILYCSLQTEHRGATPHPSADHTFAFGVVVTVLEMARRVPRSVRHGPNRQHETSGASAV